MTDTAPTTPAPDSPEYVQMMLDRAAAREAANTTPATAEPEATVPPMPEGGYDKFYDPKTGAYNWQAHVKELEFKLAQKSGKAAKEPEGAPKADEPKPALEIGDAEVQDVVARAGLSMDSLAESIRTTGALPEDAVNALVNQGIPKALIEEYVELAKFHQERQVADALAYVGGEDRWQEVAAWAANNLTADEKAAYNQMLASPSWKVAVDALTARMGASSKVAGEPSLRMGSTGSTGPGYASRAELHRDMRDPRYASDPAFRHQVMQRVAQSRFSE